MDTEVGEPNSTVEVSWVMGKSTVLEMPPLGAGLKTLMRAVPGVAISAAVIAAVNFVELTKMVTRVRPFHRTVDPEINPVPLISRLKSVPPAVAAAGNSG